MPPTVSPATASSGRISSPVLAGSRAGRIRTLGWGLLAVALIALIASAWIHEDAYITFRVIDNFLHGRGLTWNPAERVQAYSHPLWLFLLTPLVALTGEYFYTSLTLTVALSLAGLNLVLFRSSRTVGIGAVAVFTLLLSKGFVDFATTGLEDSLTRLLIVLFVLRLRAPEPEAPRHLGQLALLAALTTLSRPDAPLLFAPALIALLVRRWRSAGRRGLATSLGALASGLAPLVLWGLFALVYYGTPLPNPAYAKLEMGVPRGWLLTQSVFYLWNSLVRDPVTLTVTVAACITALRRRHPVASPLAAGAALYLGYVVWIGGGYMSGRLLATPFFLSVLALAQYPLDRLWRRRPALALALALAALAPRIWGPFVLEKTGKIDAHGIGDERRLYYPFTGLLPSLGTDRWPDHYLRDQGEAARGGPPVQVAGTVGMFGFYAGPGVHVVDWHGLTDPLLARLPAIVTGPYVGPDPSNWRPGHGWRPIPEGYLDSLREGADRIADPHLARYWEVLRRITRGPLWDRERLAEILELNLGRYDGWRDAYVAAHPDKFDRFPTDPRPSSNVASSIERDGGM